jgi:uncharacterized damage-inducible protein DinB
MTPWFQRSFPRDLPLTDAPAVFGRLRQTVNRLDEALRDLPAPVLIHRRGSGWSIQEHAGHLLDLEPLWDQRLDDFDRGASVLHAADLQNRKTYEARHNERPVADVLDEFRRARTGILARLEKMTGAELERRALHPRLQQPMSVVDLSFFVAEHDDHHLETIGEMTAALRGTPVYALDLMTTIESVVPRLLDVGEEAASVRPAPGKWSPKEIIGHLIDSASNNHQRFVRAMFQDDLVFLGYMQDKWVAVQRYQDMPWSDLVTLWASFNRHLARYMAAIPEDARLKRHARHNLDVLASNAVPATEPATLDYFMSDYVWHLHHHLKQIPFLQQGKFRA